MHSSNLGCWKCSWTSFSSESTWRITSKGEICSVNISLAGKNAFSGYWMWEYQVLGLLPQLRISLKACLSFRLLYKINWVLQRKGIVAQLLCPILFPLSFYQQWSQGCSLINLLFANLHIKIYFWRSPK